MMEDEKKKKRNKKKKNKQNNKVAEDTAVASNGEGGAASVDPQNHLDNGQNHHSRAVGAATDNDEVKVNTQQSNGVEPLDSNSAEMEKRQMLQIEASLKETIRHLRSEHDLHLQKEADLKIRLAQLQSEKESWLQKEAHLEGKVSLLSDDKASLELKQKSNKEMVSNMEMELGKLRLQVEWLEESKNVSMQENQRLADIISGMQAQIQSLESSNISIAHALDEQRKHSSEYDVLNSQLEGSCALVEKLMTENAELVEKVNELYLKLDRRRETSRHTSPIRYDSTLGRDGSTAVADRHSISSKNLILLSEKTEAPSEIVITQDEPSPSDKGDADNSIVMSNSLRSDESGEVVQIPLNETEAQTSELQSGGAEYESVAAVPLSDAPLIGAPFRFISFVAGYVSGADLVDKNSTSSK